MTEFSFKLGWNTLLNALPNQSERIGDETRDIYWQALRDIPDDLWQDGVTRALKNSMFFPTIPELGKACLNGKLTITNARAHQELTWEQALSIELRERAKALEASRHKALPEPGAPVDVGALLRETIEKMERRFGRPVHAERRVVLDVERDPGPPLVPRTLTCFGGCGRMLRVPLAEAGLQRAMCEECATK